MRGSCVSGGTAVMSDQAEKGGNFQFLGGNITGKFLEVKEDFLSKNSSDLETLPTFYGTYHTSLLLRPPSQLYISFLKNSV
jgi:hypothetical protein